MKKRNYLLAAALLLSATPLLAGLRYEFTESTRTEETSKSTSLVARAVVEGQMSRVDVIAGNRYPVGNFMISHGDGTVYIVDPADKSYVEYSTNQRAVNPDRVKISNLKTSFTEINDGSSTIIAGYPTKHYRLNMDYDITVMMGTIAINQSVTTVIDKWMTTAFDHVISAYRDNIDDLKTGNPEIDSMLETEASKFKGLALKERTQIVTKSEQKSRNSNVNLPSTRKRTKEMNVSKIEEATISVNDFAIPVEFTKGTGPKAPGTTTQYLTMKPDGQ